MLRTCTVLPVSLGGPVGTAAAYGARGPAVLARVRRALRVSGPRSRPGTPGAPPWPASAPRDRARGEACGKIAADVLVMSQTEVGEVREGTGGPSSSMSHKANPAQSVLVAAAARQLPALGSVLAAAAAAEQERPAGAWHAEWQPLRAMLRLAGGRGAHRGPGARLQFDQEAMTRNLDLLLGAVGQDRGWALEHTAQVGAGWTECSASTRRYRVTTPAGAPRGRSGRRRRPSYSRRRWAPRWRCGTGWPARSAERYRVVRFDTRGHGARRSGGPYTVTELAADVVVPADELGLDRFAFVGLSLGGAIGQILAVEHPERLAALVLCCTVPKFGEPGPWLDRAAQVRAGMGGLVEPTRGRWFTAGFRVAHPEEVERLIGDDRRDPPRGTPRAARRWPASTRGAAVGRVDAPTRVIAGAQDPVRRSPRVPRHGRRDPGSGPGRPGRRVAHRQRGRPARFDAAVLEHLERTYEQRLRRGHGGCAGKSSATRTSTGPPKATTEVTGDFQELITRYAWGGVWTRDGLDRRSRSMVTLTALVAGRHFDELEFHLRAALTQRADPGGDRRGAHPDRRLLRGAGRQLRVRGRQAGARPTRRLWRYPFPADPALVWLRDPVTRRLWLPVWTTGAGRSADFPTLEE